MATLERRLAALECRINTAPMATLRIDTAPTPDQQATIDHCSRTGRRLFVYCNRTSAAWMHGLPGMPPWEVQHGTP